MAHQGDDTAELKSLLFKRLSDTYERCLWPFNDCKGKPSHAHSIQNAHVMDLLHKNNHVLMPRPKILSETEPQTTFHSVGRNDASTFTGLCNAHDSELFRPVDTKAIDTVNHEHLFLVAYRSVIKQFHANLASAQSAQRVIADAASIGALDPNNPPPALLGMILESYESYLYWSKFNNLLTETDYTALQHVVVTLPSTRPCLAVSALFALEIQRRDVEAAPSLILNVFPKADGTHTAILSYLPEHRGWADTILPRIEQAAGHYLLYEISKLILEKCENFVLSPSLYDTFSDKKKRVLLEYFSGNVSGLDKRLHMDSPELMLFE